MVIGNPYEFDYLYQEFDENDYYSDYKDTTVNRTGLMLDGIQDTYNSSGWLTAESINSFNIYFYRRGFDMLNTRL